MHDALPRRSARASAAGTARAQCVIELRTGEPLLPPAACHWPAAATCRLLLASSCCHVPLASAAARHLPLASCCHVPPALTLSPSNLEGAVQKTRDLLASLLVNGLPAGCTRLNGPADEANRLPNTLSIGIKGVKVSHQPGPMFEHRLPMALASSRRVLRTPSAHSYRLQPSSLESSAPSSHPG